MLASSDDALLDVRSEFFDPIVALNNPQRVTLPYPNVPPLDNVAKLKILLSNPNVPHETLGKRKITLESISEVGVIPRWREEQERQRKRLEVAQGKFYKLLQFQNR
jgi:hypothetical protein